MYDLGELVSNNIHLVFEYPLAVVIAISIAVSIIVTIAKLFNWTKDVLGL